MVKDDAVSHAVFTEQGSSASHLTATKVLDVISRLPDCAGEARDAVSAYTQVRLEDASNLLRLLRSECPVLGYVYHVLFVQNLAMKYKTLWYHLKETLSGIHWQDYCGSENSRNSYSKKTGRKYLDGNAYLCTSKIGLFISEFVDPMKMGRQEETPETWVGQVLEKRRH